MQTISRLMKRNIPTAWMPQSQEEKEGLYLSAGDKRGGQLPMQEEVLWVRSSWGHSGAGVYL